MIGKPTTLFIYGTLKRGMRNHRLIAGGLFLGEARTRPIYRLLHLGAFPGMIQVGDGGMALLGEVWEVDSAKLAQLDEFEGVPHVFDRRTVELQGDTPAVEAYFYAGQPRDFPDCGPYWVDHNPSTSSIE